LKETKFYAKRVVKQPHWTKKIHKIMSINDREKKEQVWHKRLAITQVNGTKTSHLNSLNLVQLVVMYQIKKSIYATFGFRCTSHYV
jgi:hypothetical protein